MECITFASYRCLQTGVYSAVYVCICTCYVYKKKQKTEHTKCICIYLTKNTTWNTDATLRHMLNNKSYFWLLSYLQGVVTADSAAVWSGRFFHTVDTWLDSWCNHRCICVFTPSIFILRQLCKTMHHMLKRRPLVIYLFNFLKSIHVFIILNWLPATRWKHLHCYAGITFPEIVMKMVAISLHSALMVPSHMYMLLLHVYT